MMASLDGRDSLNVTEVGTRVKCNVAVTVMAVGRNSEAYCAAWPADYAALIGPTGLPEGTPDGILACT